MTYNLVARRNAADFCREADAQPGDRLSNPTYWIGDWTITLVGTNDIIVRDGEGVERVCTSIGRDATVTKKGTKR